ncbi:hypothetical protein [Escherichia phage BEK6]|nr:hypothetical protein [Escherichia phage BEK6]
MDCCRYCNDSHDYCTYSNIASDAMMFLIVAKSEMKWGVSE